MDTPRPGDKDPSTQPKQQTMIYICGGISRNNLIKEIIVFVGEWGRGR